MWQQINGRDVFVVNHHHEVLPAWVQAYQTYQRALPLITLDYHTDLRQAFLSYGSVNGRLGINSEGIFLLASGRLAQVNIHDAASISEAISDLRYDEHIDFAIRLGMVLHAYIFLSWDSSGMDHTNATVFRFSPCLPSCTKAMHDEACDVAMADMVIDDSVLGPRIASVENDLNLEATPYILDIDLDVFNTQAAIHPPNANSFHRLIHHANIITVAREKRCVDGFPGGCCLEQGLTANYLETELLRHIESS